MSGIVKIQNDRHLSQNWEKLAEFRKESRFCDITLLVGDRQIKAHKVVLAAASKYFNNILQNETSSGTSESLAVLEIRSKIPDDIMLTLINYFYTGIIEYTEDNVMLLIESLDEMGVECESFLHKFINNGNCFEMLHVKDKFCNVNLMDTALLHIRYNLTDLYTTDKFKSLSKDELLSILSDSQGIGNSLVVFKSITTWIENDPKTRANNFPELINYVQLNDLTSREIKTHILTNELFRNDATSCKWFVNAVLHKDSHLSMYLVEKFRMYIFARGPRTNMTILRRRERRNSDGEDFDEHESHRPELDSFSVTKYKNLIYAVGGKRHNQIVNIGLKYDVENETWREFLCPIGKAGCGVCTNVSSGKMFVVGGVIGGTCQRSCSCYDYESGRWTQLPDMMRARWNPGVAVHHSAIYAFGGLSSDDQPIVERYDSREGFWTYAGTSPFRSGSVASRLHDNIYCLNIGTTNIYAYDAKSMHFPRTLNDGHVRGEWMTTFDGQMYLLYRGGIMNVNPDLNQWEDIINRRFACYSVCII